MARVLIAYGTVEGHTAKIAGCMRDALEELGHDVELLDVAHAGAEGIGEGIDRVIVGGPIHAGHHPGALTAFAKANRAELADGRGALFTVCLAAADDTAEARETCAGFTRDFTEETGWDPSRTAVFAGCLAWTQYGAFTRLLMKLITRAHGVHDQDVHRDYDYTDYDAVRRFAREAVAAATPRAATP